MQCLLLKAANKKQTSGWVSSGKYEYVFVRGRVSFYSSCYSSYLWQSGLLAIVEKSRVQRFLFKRRTKNKRAFELLVKNKPSTVGEYLLLVLLLLTSGKAACWL